MNRRMMVLPSRDPLKVRVVIIPEDMEEQEAFRHATGVIARVEVEGGASPEEIDDALEANGFELVEFMLGPALD